MIAVQSEIKLEKFAVLQSHFSFDPPKRNPKDVQKLFNTYEIDIDFAHHINKDDSIQVFTKIGINQNSKSLPGYQLFVEGAGFFSIDKTKELAEKDENNLKFYSTVSIIIGYLRNTLSSMTSSAPLGTYILPPIDMTDLFRKKSESKNENSKN